MELYKKNLKYCNCELFTDAKLHECLYATCRSHIIIIIIIDFNWFYPLRCIYI